jgi:histidinol-phosphatase
VSIDSEHSADLGLALALAAEADLITTARFTAADLHIETKPDLTPVTDADRDVEAALRRTLATARPSDAILGEEYGEDGSGGATRRWVIDPIDGTKNFVRGVPVWATLIALQVDGRTAVGVISAPALGRRWWAATGTGAWLSTDVGRTRAEPRRLRVSAVARLADASLSYSGLGGWAEVGRAHGLLDLAGSVWRTRAYGDFWSHVLVAEGAVDISCEPEVSLWDLAALDVLVTEAGGTFTDLAGRPGPGGGSAVASNGILHDVALSTLAAR